MKRLLVHSDEEAWAEQRRQIITAEPAAGPLLESIATFVSAGVTPRTGSIFRYATYLPGSRYSHQRVQHQFDEAARRWAVFDIVASQGLYTIPEPLVLPLLLPVDEARRRLAAFVEEYRPNLVVSLLLTLLKPLDFFWLPEPRNPTLRRLLYRFLRTRLYKLWLRPKTRFEAALLAWPTDWALLLSELGSGIKKTEYFSSNALLERARQYYHNQKYEEALYYLDRSIVLNPNRALAFAYRASIYRGMGRHEESLTNLKRAIELDPNDSWAIAQRGITYREMERYHEALTDFNRAV
ncbi:MAG: tetratricopeptide repeat protein [Chloroflexi bacterium]|nr:tetratricopeptide repeat protein [Chloroflexota bacterium]